MEGIVPKFKYLCMTRLENHGSALWDMYLDYPVRRSSTPLRVMSLMEKLILVKWAAKELFCFVNSSF